MKSTIFKNPRFYFAVLALVFLFGILFFDLSVYVNYASGKKFSDEEIERAFLLNTPVLQKAANEISAKKEFLRSPTYPLIKEPF